jgi:DNA (cytosine-5)-methyltransferase 1
MRRASSDSSTLRLHETVTLRVLDLFSGIGGFSLGLERAGMRTVAFCEIEPYCRAVLRKHWPDVPIFEDVRNLRAEYVGPVDVICGGYPCQPFSVAGKRAGQADDRHLWPEFARLVRELRPSWVLAENVVGHISLGLDEVLSDLESLGYSSRPFVIPACAVGADHRRDRLWIVAHADGEGLQERYMQPGVPGEAGRLEDGEDAALDVAWAPEPDLVRVVHGVPGRTHRIRALGNAVVPQIPEIIGRAILQAEGFFTQ